MTYRIPEYAQKEPLYLDNYGERATYRQKALQAALYVKIREEEEERRYEVRYVRDAEDPTLWKRQRIRERSPKEQKERQPKK